MGDGGLVPVGNRWERNGVEIPIAGNGDLGEGSEEDCLLVEGVLGCGTLQSSRAGGGSGLGPAALAFCADRRWPTRMSELRRSRVGCGQEPDRQRGLVERSGSGGVKSLGSPALTLLEARPTLGARL
jgi:hypothetical protein